MTLFHGCILLFCYFNSHPHEEDDDLAPFVKMSFVISTHILTKRMTGCVGTAYREKDISTHILTKRMTPGRLGGRFQKHISTHILTKRMTDCRTICVSKNIFQLTSSRRGWRSLLFLIRACMYFNSHPHEEDDICHGCRRVLSRIYFNSHPHEEDDRVTWLSSSLSSISTHILTKRMTTG